MLSSKQSLLNLYSVLLNGRKAKLVEEWQAQKANYKMVEVQNIFFQCSIDVDMSYADHPWADDHFHERVGGEATNPGRTFTYWPYYKDDDKHRPGEMFSHTYQERFWPPAKQGIRYTMGSLEDIVQRLKLSPTSRQAFLSIWHPEDQSVQPARRLPCTIGYWFKVNDNKVDVTYLIRSCDAIRHLHNDIYMTQLLAQYVANRLGYGLGTMSMWIGSLHCFESDIYELRKRRNKCADSLLQERGK
jgi:thymidylate synthase